LIRSSTGSGNAPGPALKLCTRFTARSETVDVLTIVDPLVRVLGLLQSTKPHSRIADVGYPPRGGSRANPNFILTFGAWSGRTQPTRNASGAQRRCSGNTRKSSPSAVQS